MKRLEDARQTEISAQNGVDRARCYGRASLRSLRARSTKIVTTKEARRAIGNTLCPIGYRQRESNVACGQCRRLAHRELGAARGRLRR
jgi:hypothetical protein